MGEIAEAAGVTRQLLYFHFDGRADLLLELSRRVDAQARRPERQARVDEAPDGLTALREAVALQGYIKPRIHGVVRAIDHLRSSDPDAERTWREREEARGARCVAVVARLQGEGTLRQEWDVTTAAALMAMATSQDAWQALVIDGDWTTARWVRETTRFLERALAQPPYAPAPLEAARPGGRRAAG